MNTVSIHEAKTHLSSLISDLEQGGQPVVICRYGRAVAELTRIRPGPRTKTAPKLSRIVIRKDPTTPTETEWEHA